MTINDTPTLCGVGAAVPTLFDPVLQRGLAEKLHSEGARLLLAGGTTGRGESLTHAQRCIVTFACAIDEVFVIAGVPWGTSDTELEELTHSGASAFLSAPSVRSDIDDVLNEHSRMKAIGTTLIAYHHPGRHSPLDPSFYSHLASHGIPIKNSDPNPQVLSAMLTAGCQVFIGSTARLMDFQTGAVGVLSGLGGVMFEDVKKTAYGDVQAQARLMNFEEHVKEDRISGVEELAELHAEAYLSDNT
jgi:dihydrodipicolinate synthase/N-acetylneuraminate lyase